MKDIFQTIFGNKGHKTWKKLSLGIVFTLLIALGALGCSGPEDLDQEKPQAQVEAKEEAVEGDKAVKEEPEEDQDLEISEEVAEEEPEDKLEALEDLKVHFIDVGQGDSIFIQLPQGETMLIDGGTRSSGPLVDKYIRGLDVDHIDYIFGTHPHEDHIGGLIEVINKTSFGKIYLPKKTHTTKTFEDLILAIQAKGKKISPGEVGEKIFQDDKLLVEIIAPEEGCEDSNLNNHSLVVRLEYGNNSFIFTGDAEKEAEKRMLARGHKLESDLLKVGHHGSDTSTTDAFLEGVNPSYAVISCGKDNKYGHPNDVTINKLKARGVEIYRTDLDGTIIASSDGEVISFDKNPSGGETYGGQTPKEAFKDKEESASPSKAGEVYITKTGSKYHKAGCSSLSSSKIPISLEDAKKSYGPCKRCKPAS